MILKHLTNLLISNRKIHYIEFRDALSILLKKSTELCNKLLQSEISKKQDYSVYQQENIETEFILRQAVDKWKQKLEEDMSSI